MNKAKPKKRSMSKAPRYYSDRTLKLLWGRAAGRCSIPECRVELIVDKTDYDPIVVIGDIAHVVAAADKGPRADPLLTPKDRDNYENLILLCKNCHARIDGQPIATPEAWLKEVKNAHEAWVRASLPERGKSTVGWECLVLRGDHPLDMGTLDAALTPDISDGEPKICAVPNDPADWQSVDLTIAACVHEILSRDSDLFERRIAVFAIAPVSACVSLGYHLTSRPNVKVFQHDRDSRSWKWPSGTYPGADLTVEERFSSSDCSEISFIFHVSAAISDEDLMEAKIPLDVRVDFRIASPSVTWLKHPEQITRTVMDVRSAMERVMLKYPRAEKWHFAYAGPAPLAIAIGQQVNPTMFPRVQLYEYRHKASPRYHPSILLGDNLKNDISKK